MTGVFSNRYNSVLAGLDPSEKKIPTPCDAPSTRRIGIE